MNSSIVIQTERLLLRQWTLADREPFAQLNADPVVNEFLAGPLSREQSDAVADRIEENFHIHGFGWWAVEVPGVSPFIGFVGLSVPRYKAHFTPCVEIGWRLAKEYWGKGFATEAARVALKYGFEEWELTEIVSLTVPANQRSRNVMEKIGMIHDPADDFEHPSLPEHHPLRKHVLYRLSREQYHKIKQN